VPGDKYMNQSIKDFLVFAKNHRVTNTRGIATKQTGSTMYCDDTTCSDCVLREKCTENNEVGMLNDKDLKSAKGVYPEYFI
jgi:hypothetical protein